MSFKMSSFVVVVLEAVARLRLNVQCSLIIITGLLLKNLGSFRIVSLQSSLKVLKVSFGPALSHSNRKALAAFFSYYVCST